MDRRSLLVATAGLAAMAAGGQAMAAARPQHGIRYVVADRRLPQSGAFAQELIGHGAQRLEITDGLTALWQNHLVPHWRDPRGTVAGLTTRAVWDGLSEQARGQFRKPRMLGLHRLDEGTGQVLHRLGLPAEVSASPVARSLALGDWPERMALLARACGNTSWTAGTACQVGNAGVEDHAHIVLVSWIVD